MESYAKTSNGRMTVQFDTFTSPKGNKGMKNVLAILKGTDPNDNRVYLVSGHYDSRRTDINSTNEFDRVPMTTHRAQQYLLSWQG